MYYSTYLTDFKNLTLVSDGKSLVELSFCPKENLVKKDDLEIFLKTKLWLSKYFKKENPPLNFALNPKGTDFQKEVWNLLLKIPYSKTTTYGEIAKIMAKKKNIARMAPQAIGQAIGKNPIPIIIPCHRVVGLNNKLTGYSGGLELKKKLLELEGNVNFF